MHVRGHTLIWKRQLPDWLCSYKNRDRDCMDSNFKADELEEIFNQQIAIVAGRYSNSSVIAYWDVVNEPINDWSGGNLLNLYVFVLFSSDIID